MFLKMQCFKMGAVIFKSNNCKCYGKQHKMLKKTVSSVSLKDFIILCFSRSFVSAFFIF